MSEQPRQPLDNLHSQLRSVLDAHIAAFAAEYDSAVEEARRSAAAAAEEALAPRIDSAVADARRAAREEAEQALASKLETAVDEARRASREEAERTLAAQIESAVADARRAAREEAEQTFAPQLESLRTEWTGRLVAEVAAARAEAERRTITEAMKARVEAEQVAAESASRMRSELEQALADERQRADAAIRAERERAETELEALKRQVEEARETASESRAGADAARTEREQRLAGVERLVRAMRALDDTRALTGTLDLLLQHAAASAGRAVVFLVTGDRVKSWRTVGFPALDAHPFEAAAAGTGLLGQALRTGDAIASGPGCPAPTFAALPADRSALAVPLTVGDRVVAALYADDLGCAPDASPAWADLVEAMARHAARVLGLITATRTVQAVASQAGGAATGDGTPVDEQSARRYARLLLSEIKLYNEPAVRLGHEHRDLLQRLGGEIDRARRVYEERVPASLTGRLGFFQQELVQTLADGDPAILGTPGR